MFPKHRQNRRKLILPVAILAALALALLLSSSASAITRSWDGGGGADTKWTTDANWSSNIEPGASDTAEFDRGAAFNYSVTFPRFSPPRDITTDRLIVGSNTVTFEPEPNTNYLVTNPATTETVRGVIIGAEADDTAAVLVSHLAILQAVAATLGHATDSSGTLTLNQNNDQFNITGSSASDTELIIGRFGTGVLNISGGADVNVTNTSGSVSLAQYAGSIGTASINGTGSMWTNSGPMLVGVEGRGTVHIASEGVVTSAGATIGSVNLSTGTVTVDGNNSRWTATGDFTVGNSGSGTLQITGGGRVVMNGAAGANSYIGRFATGVGVVAVNSGRWDNSRALYIGNEGTGTLTVAQGQVTNLAAYLGGNILDRSKRGTATVSGIGALWNNGGELVVGNFSTGVLLVEAGGVVTSINGTVGFDTASIGTATVTGSDGQNNASTWNNSGDLTVAKFSQDAELRIEAGGLVLSANGVIGAEIDSDGMVTLTGTDEDGNRSTWDNTGNLTIGNEKAPQTSVLLIEAGANVSNVNGIIANNAGSKGDVTVTGGESTWTNTGDLQIGIERAMDDIATGTLNILDGGTVLNVDGDIGVQGKGTVTVAGSDGEDNPSKWIIDNALAIGTAAMGDGMLTIEAGGFVSDNNGSIGFDANGMGSVIVTGSGSSWTHTTFLRAGDSGTGTLLIEAGGSVSNDGDGFVAAGNMSDGMATVTGDDSTWTSGGDLFVGNGMMATGILTIEAGGEVSNENGTIGNNADSDGTVTVTNANWTNSMDLFVGDQDMSIGRLFIEEGGIVSNTDGFIGNDAGSEGTVTVSGDEAVWTNNGTLRVGFFGNGTLEIESGGRVSNPNAAIATGADSTGTATVSGAGSSWTTSGRLSIGGDAATATNGGTGTLRIQAGGAVTVAQDIVLFPDGLVDFEGGTLSSPMVSVQVGGEFDWTGGTLHVDVFDGNLVNKGGTLAPGESAGSTAIIGNYTQQAAGTLQAEIGGTLINTQYDFVNVTGNAILGGELELALINGFVPSPTDMFTIFNADNLLNFFSNVINAQRLTTTDGTGSFLVHYGPTSMFNPDQIVLSSFEPVLLPGDYNNNGAVDAADYVVWRKNTSQSYEAWRTLFGQSALSTPVDFNNDGTFDAADYVIWRKTGGTQYNAWRNQFGEPSGAGTGAAGASPSQAAVPEPATLVLLMFAAAGWCLRRGRAALKIP